jgi:hypothetical protein
MTLGPGVASDFPAGGAGLPLQAPSINPITNQRIKILPMPPILSQAKKTNLLSKAGGTP